MLQRDFDNVAAATAAVHAHDVDLHKCAAAAVAVYVVDDVAALSCCWLLLRPRVFHFPL